MEARPEDDAKATEKTELPAVEQGEQASPRTQSHRDISGEPAGAKNHGPEAAEAKQGEKDKRSDQRAKPYRDATGPKQAQTEAKTGSKGKASEASQRRAEKTRGGQNTADQKVPVSDKDFEKFQRNRFASPSDGVGFRHNQKKTAPGEMNRFVKGLPEALRKAMMDPNAEIFIYTSADRPGSEEYNQRLTEERGEVVKAELIDKFGAKAKITVVPLGERAARADDRSPMSVKEPGDQDLEDRLSDPWDRTAKIEIRPYKEPPPPPKFEGQHLDAPQLKEHLEAGERLFNEKVVPFGEAVRAAVPLERNPAFPDSTKDPKEFARKAGEFIVEAFGNLAKKGAETAVGGLMESVGASDIRRKETRKRRAPLHEAMARGVAAGLDHRYADQTKWKPKLPGQREFYEAAKKSVEAMSKREQEQLGLFLTRWSSDFYDTAHEGLVPNMSGESYRAGVKKYFASDRHFYSD